MIGFNNKIALIKYKQTVCSMKHVLFNTTKAPTSTSTTTPTPTTTPTTTPPPTPTTTPITTPTTLDSSITPTTIL